MSDSPSPVLNPHVTYLGPLGSFSHQAALDFFGNTADLHPHDSFDSILNAVQADVSQISTATNQRPQYAIVPIENSSNGTVVSLLDLLADRAQCYPDLKVCAEYYLPVHHCLLVSPSGDTLPNDSDDDHNLTDYAIEKLYTHPQVWGQCTRFLSENLKAAARIDTASTSAAARFVAQNSAPYHESSPRPGERPDHIAAIASALAAQTHRLHVLASNIEDEANNTTRFLILYNHKLTTSSPQLTLAPLHNNQTARKHKTLVSFTIDHSTPGSLSNALSIFRAHAFNLTSIETRPSRLRPWHYIFFVECEEEISRDARGLEKMFEELRGRTQGCRDFGSWVDAWGGEQRREGD